MEGRLSSTVDGSDYGFKPTEEYLKAEESTRKISQEIAAIMFSSEEHKEILSVLKEVRASRNE
jgi:hypothetical protein